MRRRVPSGSRSGAAARNTHRACSRRAAGPTICMRSSRVACTLRLGVARSERGSVRRVSTGFDSRTPEGMSRTCSPASVSRAVVNYPISPTFLRHTENLRAVAAALTQLERAHKLAIREHDQPSEHALRKVHTLLLGVYAEARLRKILDDPTGFNDRERGLIWLERSQDRRWVSAVDFAARRHYGVLSHQSLDAVLPARALQRVESVIDLLGSDLAPIITDRNKLAHGQWVWQLKSRSEDSFLINQASYDYNYVALRARYRLLDAIGQLVNVLCVSEPTFDRDFDSLMRKIDQAKSELDGAGYADLVAQLRKSRKSNLTKVASATDPTDSAGAALNASSTHPHGPSVSKRIASRWLVWRRRSGTPAQP